jgi:hypothetical protein
MVISLTDFQNRVPVFEVIRRDLMGMMGHPETGKGSFSRRKIQKI